MIKGGLAKIKPRRKDYSLLHTFGALGFDTTTLPANFSVYDGRQIPDQNALDNRFAPAVRPLPYGCVGETGTFDAGIQDNETYRPDDFYFAIPPGTDGTGRDIRKGLDTAVNRGFKLSDGSIGAKRTAYFNCYGAGKIDDFDAARIALWINQMEKRSVWVGTFWYPEFEHPDANGSLPLPSFNIADATLHEHLVTGWRTLPDGTVELEDISWQGMDFAKGGLDYISREKYNALMAQPYTGAFTTTKLAQNQSPVPIGMQAYADHIVYLLVQFIRQLWVV